MKRGILGIGLLTVLLLFGLLTAGDMARRHAPIQAALRVAALLAEQNQWEDAEIYQQRAESLWKKSTAASCGSGSTFGSRKRPTLPRKSGRWSGGCKP